MRKRIFLIGFLFLIIFTQVAFAKYTLSESSSLEVYIDKTPPVINLIGKDKNETYKESNLTDVVLNNSEVTINTSDNIKVEKNEYCYNPTENNFDNKESSPFDTGKEFTEDGFYKITTIDTSGNKTEIIFLIDKTPPDVTVEFYKKGEEPKLSSSKQVLTAGTTRHLLTENVLETAENEKEEIIQESVKEATQENTIKRAAARSTSYVTNETELRNALNNRITDIVTRGSINIGSTLDINYNVTISPATNENALRFGGYGNFFNVRSGATLTITSMVIDCASNCRNRDVTAINVNSGGALVFNRNSIIDCGNNYGIIINGRATMNSSMILGGKKV